MEILPVILNVDPQHLRARIDETAWFPASAQQLWALLSDPARAPAHLPAGISMREEHTRPDGKQAWQVSLELLGKHLETRAVLEEELPAQRTTIGVEGALTGWYRLSLTEENGGVRLREQIDYRVPGVFLDQTLGRLAEPVIRRMLRQHFAALERLLQTSAR